jgi:hypothetical protein
MTKNGMPALLSALKALSSTRVLVGVPSDAEQPHLGQSPGADARKPDAQHPSPPNNALLAYVHNFGSPARGIPPRPFMEPGIKSVQPQITAQLKAAGDAAMAGDEGKMMKHFHAAGLIAQGGTRMKITTGPFVPLAPATIAARRRRVGASRSAVIQPLLDSGQLRQSISYIVRRNVR